jgi:hypothetical protein
MEFAEPECVVSVHSHDSDLAGNKSDKDIILYHPGRQSPLTLAIQNELVKNAFKVQILDYIPSNQSLLLFPNDIVKLTELSLRALT